MNSNRDWIQETLAHRESSRVPYNFMFSPVAQRRVEAHYGENLAECLDLPMRMTSPQSIKPLYASPEEFGPTAIDEFGVAWSTNPIDRGSPIGPCLPEPSLTGYTFPDPFSPHRFVGLQDWCARQAGHYRIVWIGDLWERATFMRGMEPLLLDVALHPAFVEDLLQHLADRILETLSFILGKCEFEAIAVSDDYGAQRGMLLSPESWRALVRPRLAQIYALAKERGCAVFHHSCGDIEPIIGDLIDIGLDILHPIQPEAMDILQLKREFGPDLTFCGGLPTQTLLVQGTPDQVREEVQRLKPEMGRGGGYILEPGITLQADIPLKNMVAMIEEARSPG
jgi:uroporphyrinogen decarboxylase